MRPVVFRLPASVAVPLLLLTVKPAKFLLEPTPPVSMVCALVPLKVTVNPFGVNVPLLVQLPLTEIGPERASVPAASI